MIECDHGQQIPVERFVIPGFPIDLRGLSPVITSLSPTDPHSWDAGFKQQKPKLETDQNMKTLHQLLSVAALLIGSSSLVLAQSSSPASASTSTSTTNTTSTSTMTSDAPYTEGSVWQITMVRAKAGMSDDYLKGLAKNLKAILEEEKKQGLVLSYKILLGDASTADDFNIMNMVEYKNMAALDNLREKTDPIGQKIVGGEQQQREGALKRAEIRDIVGSKTMREIRLK